MFGRTESDIAIGSAFVSTTSSRSVGSWSASRAVVVPASSRIVPSSGSSASASRAIRSFSAVRTPIAGRERGLEAQPLDRDRAAVHAPQERVALEGRQVAADRLGRDRELLGQGRDLDPAAGPRALDDPALPLLRVHVG